MRAARGLPPSSLGLMSVAREKPSQTEGLRTRLQDPLLLNFFHKMKNRMKNNINKYLKKCLIHGLSMIDNNIIYTFILYIIIVYEYFILLSYI